MLQIFSKSIINEFAQWLSLNLFHLNYLAFIYTILEHFISGHNIYHGFFFFQEEAYNSQDEVVCYTVFSIFSLLNQALVVVSYSNTEALRYWTPLRSIKARGVQRNPAEIVKARSVCWLHLAFTTGEPK